MSLLHYDEMGTELGWLCLDFFPLIATPQTCNTITEDSCIHQAQRRKMIFGLERTSYLISPLFYYSGFPSGTVVKSACQCRRHRRLQFDPWVRKSPWMRKWQPTPAFWPGKSHEQRGAWRATIHEVAKCQM